MTMTKTEAAVQFALHAEKLSLLPRSHGDPERVWRTTAVEAEFVTPLDPVIKTADGNRLPAVPLDEARRLNELGNALEGRRASSAQQSAAGDGPDHARSTESDAPLRHAIPPSRTHPLFPPLPLYGPPSLVRDLQCVIFRFTSFFLSLGFLAVIVLGSAFTAIPLMFRHLWLRSTLSDPDARRPFYEEERRRRAIRQTAERAWKRDRKRRKSIERSGLDDKEADAASGGGDDEFVPTEGGKDPLVCDAAYYARRVGLDIETFEVQTEDGFIIDLWHVYNPKEYEPLPEDRRRHRGPEPFTAKDEVAPGPNRRRGGKRRYPVLLVHGLLQSAGAYCTNDDESLAFYLCKSGYDVWLGSNRCGFSPRHSLLGYSDPRMWAWNIRQMGVMDLPALVSRVLAETGFPRLGLVCHSQGTTETFVALAKEQRPELGARISVFCALAPAVYAGPLIGKMYFKFMRAISPAMFRLFFGIHAFIPLMMTMHGLLPGGLYGALGYRVFSFLFDWSDDRWERDLRDRMFQFAPVYVSSESMRWWLGRECFARHRCILATRDHEDEDEEEEGDDDDDDSGEDVPLLSSSSASSSGPESSRRSPPPRAAETAWYDERMPPLALWIAGKDELVDGRRLLRRLRRGREPHVRLVHAKIVPEYEHLDVIWAMDSIHQVGREVRDVLWRTLAAQAREGVECPAGCEDLGVWDGASEVAK